MSSDSKNEFDLVFMVDVDGSDPTARDGSRDGHTHDRRAHARPRTGSLEGGDPRPGLSMVEAFIPYIYT